MISPHHHQISGLVIRPLNTTGYVVAPPVPRIVRGTYSFFYLKAGEVLVDAGDESFLLGPDTFLLIPPEVQYSVQWYDRVQAVMGAFEESFITDSSCSLLLVRRPVMCKISADDSKLVEETINKVMREQSRPSMAQFTLNYLFRMLSEHFSPNEHENEHIAVRFVDEVFNRKKPLKTIAEYAHDYGITPGHLNKVVRNRTGRSASEWVLKSRLNYAKFLLRGTSMPIIDVAANVGLYDQSYFARFFKKNTGMSPLEYRKSSTQ